MSSLSSADNQLVENNGETRIPVFLIQNSELERVLYLPLSNRSQGLRANFDD